MICDKGKSATVVVENVGIYINTLYRWVNEYKDHGKNAFPGNVNLKPEDDEIRN